MLGSGEAALDLVFTVAFDGRDGYMVTWSTPLNPCTAVWAAADSKDGCVHFLIGH